MSIWELLAQAGGLSETAADVIFVVRAGKDESSPTRIPIDLRGLRDPKAATPIPQIVLQGGDTIFVPKAPQFYLSGQVGRPGMYRVEEKLTLEKALINAGGVTALGSERRIEVKRRNEKGVEAVTRMKLGDLVKPDDVIRVKERLF
jgi:polysaccharide export outer membrane protein